MKNKKITDEQSISLFDGHEDLIKEVEEANAEAEAVEAAELEEAAHEVEQVEESSTPFVIDTVEEGEDPYYDEDDVVMSESDEDEPAPEDDAVTDEEAEEESLEDGITEDETLLDEADVLHEEKKPEPAPAEKPRRIHSLFDFVEQFIFALAAVFIITSFFFKYSNVVGDSMQNTLQSGEKLVLSCFLYDPEPGDIVVIDDRSLKDPIVKRVIAVGGQTVKITRDAVYVDGVMLIEDYVYTDTAKPYQYSVVPCEALLDKLIGYEEGVYYEILVPENEVFVMGDHRNDSYDSRDIGTLHEDAVLGKAVLRFAPFDKFGKID